MNKFRKQLVKFGMEQEFKNWITNLPVKGSQEFSIGDRVKIINPYKDSVRCYGLGKVGIIKCFDSGRSGTYKDLMKVRFEGESEEPWLFKSRFERI